MSRRVLLTGADSGLGLALARRFLEAGDRLLATDRHTEPRGELAALLSDHAARAEYLRLDVVDTGAWDAAIVRVVDLWGGLDLLVNNAGIADGGAIETMSDAAWRRIIDVNLLGPVNGCRAAVPLLKRQGSGHVVNVASVAGLVHPPSMSSYNCVKAAVVALSETLEFELGPFGIAVSVVCPSFFRTNLADSLFGEDAKATAMARTLIDGAPRGADEIAAATMRGIGRKKRLILTERDGYAAYYAKRCARPLYARVMRRLGAKANRGEVPL